MGHSLKNKDQTVRYTEFSLLNNDREGKWFDRAFKHHFKRNDGRKHSLLLPQQLAKNSVVESNPSCSCNGPAEVLQGQQERFLGEFLKKLQLYFLGVTNLSH